MGSFSIWHWLIVLLVVLILFGGGGKLSRLMGDMARGITAFRKGLKEGEAGEKGEQKAIEAGGATGETAKPAARDEAAKS